MEVTLEDIPVMYVISPNGPKGATEAFKKLENAIHWELKGRKFYGTMIGKSGEYRACMSYVDGSEPERLGFETWTIPGGRYFRDKMKDWQKRVAEIAPRCNEIIQKVNYDDSRPIIEFYFRLNELHLFVPVK